MFLRRPAYLRADIVIPPSSPSGGMVTARYWRIDNFVYQDSSRTEIYNIGFWDSGVDPIPVTITTNNGDQTTALTNGSVINISSITYMDFDYGTDITADMLRLRARELDTDYIISADISYSDDGTSWTKIGSFNYLTSWGSNAGVDGSTVFWDLGVEEGVQLVPSSYVIVGGPRTEVFLPKRDTYLIYGRHPSQPVFETVASYVITIPV